MAAPASNGSHFRMMGRADDHRLSPLLLRLGNDLMDTLDVWAGGVQNAGSPLLQALIGLPALPVGADDYAAPLGHLVGILYYLHALAGQAVHHIAVVDDIAQHDTGLSGLGG